MALQSTICIFIKMSIISAALLRLVALDCHQHVPSPPHPGYKENIVKEKLRLL